MLVVAISVAVGIFAVFLYGAAVLPLLMIIACTRATNMPRTQKRVWLVAMLVLFPFASWVYAVATPQRWVFRISGWMAMFGFIAMLSGVQQFAAADARALTTEIDRAETIVHKPALVISDDHRAALAESLRVLRTEVSSSALRADDNAAGHRLVDLLLGIMGDRRVSDAEFAAFQSGFGARHTQPGGLIDRSTLKARAIMDEWGLRR